MEMYGYSFTCESDLQHHGIKGQKWGVRRFQNEDGSLTAAGKKRYGDYDSSDAEARLKGLNKLSKDISKAEYKKSVADYKMEKAYKKGKIQKAEKYKRQSEELSKAIDSGKKESDRLVKDAAKNGLTVKESTKHGYANTGKAVVGTLIAGPVGLAIVGRDIYRGATGNAKAAGVTTRTKYEYAME